MITENNYPLHIYFYKDVCVYMLLCIGVYIFIASALVAYYDRGGGLEQDSIWSVPRSNGIADKLFLSS